MECSPRDLGKLKNFVKKVEQGKFNGIITVHEYKVKKEGKYGNVNVLLLGGEPDDMLFMTEYLIRFVRERMKETPKNSVSRKLSSSSRDSLNYFG